MHTIYKLLFFFSICFYITGCNNPKSNSKNNLPDNIQISGQILGAANQSIHLEAVSSKGKIRLSETTTEVDGSFELKAHLKGLGLYQLTIGNKSNKSVPLTISPNDKIKIQANYVDFERLPIITGPSWAPLLTNYMRIFNDFAYNQLQLMNTPDLSEEQQLEQFFQFKKPLDDYAFSMLTKYPSNPAAIVLTTTLTPAMGFEKWNPENLVLLKKVAKAFSAKYPTAPITRSFSKQVFQIEDAYNQFKNPTNPSNIVTKAPEISLPNPDGQIMRLSELKGKVVLIDFWASWCSPCRAENPNVVNLYKKYASKGFTVFSVSLDSDVQAWKRAIKSDGLIWNTHVSDLKQWETPLIQQFKFNSIPYTVLIDKAGNIVGTNLRGNALEDKLISLLK